MKIKISKISNLLKKMDSIFEPSVLEKFLAVGVAANTYFHYDQVFRLFSAVFRAPQDGQFHYTSSLRHQH